MGNMEPRTRIRAQAIIELVRSGGAWHDRPLTDIRLQLGCSFDALGGLCDAAGIQDKARSQNFRPSKSFVYVTIYGFNRLVQKEWAALDFGDLSRHTGLSEERIRQITGALSRAEEYKRCRTN